jgi:adenylate cyclase
MYNLGMTKEYSYNWELHLKASPEALWPFVADTNRFNRDTGLPTVERLGIENGVSHMRFRLPLVRVEWDENPFEWTYPYRFGVVRNYRTGPLLQMRVLCEMTPENGGARLNYKVWARPRNLLGDAAIAVGIGLLSAQLFKRTFKDYDALAAAGKSPLDVPGTARLTAGANRRLEAGRAQLERLGFDPELVARLVSLLSTGDDLSLGRMRPFALADYWLAPRRDTLELFLQAARIGLLDIHWDLVCPICRGASESHKSLGEVHDHSHCASCQMDFEANFDQQVEVTFKPNPTVRVLAENAIFCVGSPQYLPHVVLGQVLGAGEKVSLATVFEEGPYILHFQSGDVRLRARPQGPDQVSLRNNSLPEGEIETGLRPTLSLENTTDKEIEFYIESGVWDKQAATAADVTSLQLFRDIFASEALRAGEELSINSVTLMFTDLRDSTRMYRQIGDAPAFGRVRQHFEILEQEVARQGGAVVKTMGDAVMAVFRQPLGALLAIQKAHAEISKVEGTPPLYLKVGIHSGPCIAVTLNERLDYFGSTVNAAARLPGLSEGGHIVLSDQTASDPQVKEWLASSGLRHEKFESTIKGFEQSFALWQVAL